MRPSLHVGLALASMGLIPLLTSAISSANPIVPETNSATQVSQTGNEFTITGGLTSGDGQTLFHGFEQFGLSADQVATFLAQPDIQAILGRVTGGNASYIDGLLRVSGSADLYLINQAGILLGANAQLDLSGSFAATTAHGVLFGDDIFPGGDPSQFTGTPTGYWFGAETGAIVNAADLTVSPGESITLIGGQVISTGTLTAPGGDITIAAIPAANLVRISHPDQVLNLELATRPESVSAATAFQPLSLPELLTGSDTIVATAVTVQPDGAIALVNTAITDRPETAIVTGSVDVSGPTGGDVTVVGDRVGLVAATVNASGETGGGTVRIGGDYQGQPPLPGSTLTVVDEQSVLLANAEQTGQGGQVILWSDHTTVFAGAIAARGGAISGNGGFVEVSGAQTLGLHGAVDTDAPVGQTGQLLLDPTDIVIRNGTGDGDDTDGLTNLLSETTVAFGDAIPTVIFESELEGLAGGTNITLQASNSITVENLTDNALTFQAGTGSITFQSGGSFTMDAGDRIVAPGRAVTITATGAVTAGDIETFGDGSAALLPDNNDGNITITGASITAGTLNALESTPIVGLGPGNISRVYLESTQGDIVVNSLLGGDGGVGVNAAQRFRAEGTFIMQATTGGGIFTPFTTSVVAADPNGDITIQRGIPVNLATLQGVAIAFDTSNTLPPTPLTFFVGPNTGPGVAVPANQSGTAGGILRTRPDRTIINAFENQTFLLETPLNTTAFENLSEIGADTTAEAADDDAVLETCEAETEEPDVDCDLPEE